MGKPWTSHESGTGKKKFFWENSAAGTDGSLKCTTRMATAVLDLHGRPACQLYDRLLDQPLVWLPCETCRPFQSLEYLAAGNVFLHHV